MALWYIGSFLSFYPQPILSTLFHGTPKPSAYARVETRRKKVPYKTHLGREKIKQQQQQRRKKRLSAGDRNICYLNVFTRGSASNRMCIMQSKCIWARMNVEHSATGNDAATRRTSNQTHGETEHFFGWYEFTHRFYAVLIRNNKGTGQYSEKRRLAITSDSAHIICAIFDFISISQWEHALRRMCNV